MSEPYEWGGGPDPVQTDALVTAAAGAGDGGRATDTLVVQKSGPGIPEHEARSEAAPQGDE